ncbi:MAG: hypothetical protein AAF517_28410, partial [Planctomycetota bacterium]
AEELLDSLSGSPVNQFSRLGDVGRSPHVFRALRLLEARGHAKEVRYGWIRHMTDEEIESRVLEVLALLDAPLAERSLNFKVRGDPEQFRKVLDAMTRDGKVFGSAKAWSHDETIAERSPIVLAERDEVSGVESIALSRDGQQVIVVDDYQTVWRWDLELIRLTGCRDLEDRIRHYLYDRRSKSMRIIDFFGRVWEVDEEAELKRVSRKKIAPGGISSFHTLDGGKNAVYTRMSESDSVLRRVECGDLIAGRKTAAWKADDEELELVSFSNDQRWIFTVTESRLRVWEHSAEALANKRKVPVQEIEISSGTLVAASELCGLMALGGDDRVRVLEVGTWKDHCDLSQPGFEVVSLAFSVEHEDVIFGLGGAGSVCMWRVPNSEVAFVFEGTSLATEVELSLDQRFLLVGDEEGGVHRVTVESEEVVTLSAEDVIHPI